MAGESEIGRIIPLIEAVIEGQKHSASSMAALGTKYDIIQTGIERLGKQIIRIEEGQALLGADVTQLSNKLDLEIKQLSNKLESEIKQLSSSVTSDMSRLSIRLDATLNRIEEIENQTERGFNEIREMRIEVVGQYNEILNALQIAINAKSDLEDAKDRIQIIERRLGI